MNEIDQNKNEISTKEEKKGKKRMFHPLSAILTITADIAFFGADASSLGLDLPVSIALASLLTFAGSFLIQKYTNKDNTGESFAKSAFLGIMAGIPMPIAGSTVGVFILGAAGLRMFSRKNK